MIGGCTADNRLYLLQLSSAGKQLRRGAIALSNGDCGEVIAVAESSDGHFIALVQGSAAGSRYVAYKLDKQLQVASSAGLPRSKNHATWAGVGVTSVDGTAMDVIQRTYASSAHYPYATRLNLTSLGASALVTVGTPSIASKLPAGTLSDASRLPDGRILLVGSYAAKNESVGWLTALDPSKAAPWNVVSTHVGAAFRALDAAVQLPDGSFWAVGTSVRGGATYPYFLRASAAGKLTWEREDTAPGTRVVTGIASLLGGRVRAIGHSLVTKDALWFGAYGLSGQLQSERLLQVRPSVPVESVGQLVTAGAGRWWSLANLVGIGRTDVALLDVDAFGFGSCMEAGKCTQKTVKDCADTNPCTFDFCSAAQGCTHVPSNCSDGSVCTTDSCDAKAPTAPIDGGCSYQAVPCNDGNACTADACDPVAGCVFTATTTACTDGNARTKGDVCKDKTCVAVPVVCADDEPCTADGCDPKSGCAFKPIADKTACVPGYCASGTCFGGKCFNIVKNGWKGCLQNAPATSCKAILDEHPGAPSFLYWIDPDGNGSLPAAQLSCDMSDGGWTRTHRFDFTKDALGWLPGKITACGAWGNVLGGYGQHGKGAVAERKVTGLPPHLRLKVVFDALRLDDWEDESLQCHVDANEAYKQALTATGSNVCGTSSADGRYPAQSGWAPHTSSEATIRFSSTLDEAASNESWGVDNVEVWVR